MIKLVHCEYHFPYPKGLLTFPKKGLLENYPTNNSLKENLAAILKIKAEDILVAPGAAEAIRMIFERFSQKKVLVPSITWPYYDDLAEQCGNNFVRFTVEDHKTSFSYNAHDLLTKSKGCDLIFIPSPNNPTGTKIDESILKEILKSNNPVVIDTAFAGFDDLVKYAGLTKIHPNLAIICSFSKFFGLPGLRVGYIVANKGFFDHYGIKEPYLTSLSDLNAEIAKNALKNIAYFSKISQEILKIKTWFKLNLKAPCRFYSTLEGNFILLGVDKELFIEYQKRFENASIKVKFLSFEEKRFIRIDVAPKKVLNKVLTILNK